MDFLRRNINKTNRNGTLYLGGISISQEKVNDTISNITGYLPATTDDNITYTIPHYINITEQKTDADGNETTKVLLELTSEGLKINGNILATGEVCAYKDGESGGGGTTVGVYNGLDSTDTSLALSANMGRVLNERINNIDIGDIDLSGYLPITGGTLTGKLKTQTSAYYANDDWGINLCNSDIVGVNSIYFNDLAQDNAEGISFARTNGNWDVLRAENGVLKFAPDYVFNSGTTDAYTIWHSGNFNPSNYLPLSGGTLSNSGSSLTINRTATNAAPHITFQSNGTDVGYIGVTPDKQYVGWDFNISQWRTFLNTGNYSSYALPLSGGTISGTEQIPLKITTSYNPTGSTFPVGLILTNTNKNNANGQNHGTAQFGYFKSAGAYIFNYNDYEKVNCAIGITDDGIAYVGKGGSITEKYEILHEGNAVNKTVGNSNRFNGYSLRGAYGFSANHIDANIMYHLNLTALSSSNFYPVIFSGTQKDLYCNVYSEGRSGGQAWNMNKLEFTFRGQGWCDTPKGITVHYYDCYDSTETTIGCVGMGAEEGNKVLWLRGGLNYYMISNITPSLKTSTYTANNEVFSVGTGFAGGTNSKVTLYWTPQSTSPLKGLYHSGSIYTGGGIQIDGGSRFKSNLTVNGSLTVDNKIETPNQWVNSLTYRNTHCVNITQIGWYRFAVSTAANNAGGTYIFSIKRNYHNTNNESYLIAVTQDFSGVQFVQLSGHYNTQLISKIRCTYDTNSTMYFDFYYNSTTLNKVTVNCIGDAYTQTPTLVTSGLSATIETSLVDGMKLGTKSAYQMTLYRNAASGGAYIMYGANNQLTKSWAAGSDGQHRFGWYYKDTSAGTDVEKMWLDSNAVLNFETGVGSRRMTIEGKSGANCFYATTGTNGWTMGNYYYTNAGSILGSIAAYGQGDNFQYYFIGKGYSDTNTIKFYNTGNVSSSCWGINNVSTNPNYELIHNGVHWYLQGYNGYLYLGAGYTKSFRIDSSGNCLSVGEVTAHSDRRLKSNIKPLEVRGELNPVTYTKDGKESIGFIADEVKEVYPELVITDDSTEDKYLSLNYAQLTAVLAAEIKELKKEINELKKKI